MAYYSLGKNKFGVRIVDSLSELIPGFSVSRDVFVWTDTYFFHLRLISFVFSREIARITPNNLCLLDIDVFEH